MARHIRLRYSIAVSRLVFTIFSTGDYVFPESAGVQTVRLIAIQAGNGHVSLYRHTSLIPSRIAAMHRRNGCRFPVAGNRRTLIIDVSAGNMTAPMLTHPESQVS
jgi:hypothetical protein